MHRAKTWWKRTPNTVRKPFIFILGFTIVGVGIVLLPLPGPGWVIIFAGFAILATEFSFAERVRDALINILKKLADYCKPYWHRLKTTFNRWFHS
ncbi:MAG TPA: PGPGW domain-containing protein [Candidatus Saccharimonadales bacterium]|nr:PGPGW domain-containing protein [Candidatus Saccharimonadales bacterium]